MNTKEDALNEYNKLNAELAAEEAKKLAEQAASLVNSESEEVEEEIVDEEVEVEEEEVEEVEEEVEEEATDITDPLVNKEKEELISMIRQQQSFEARRGTEIGELRKEVAQIKAEKLAASKEEVSEEEEEEVRYIKNVVSDVLVQKQAEEQALQQEREHLNYLQNRKAWDNLEKQSELFSVVAPKLNEEFGKLGKTPEERMEYLRKDPDWVESKIFETITGSLVSKESALSRAAEESSAVAKRKKSAITAKGKTAGTQAEKKKSVKEMTAAEYKEHLRETNPQIFK